MLTFQRGERYTRPDVKELAGLPRTAKGGNWDTGVVEHANVFIIFANVGAEGRTGHDYRNRWEDAYLRWYHKEGSHLGWRSVQKLLEPYAGIHIFWRSSNEPPFEYAGTAHAVEITDSSPVEVLWSFDTSNLSSEKEPLI
jgi:5-methylcytosine-specific restriction enzyme A